MMKWPWKILSLPLFLLTILSSGHRAAALSTQLRRTIFSEVESAAASLAPLNSSASNLASILTPLLNATADDLSFNSIQQKIAPWLFVAISTIPNVSQASYTAKDGKMFFSYAVNDAQNNVFALFSNTSSLPPQCHTQPVDRLTGELSGRAVCCGSRGETELVFVYNAELGGKGLISMAYPTKVVDQHFAHLADLANDDLYLATWDGRALVEAEVNDTRVRVSNGGVSVEAVAVDGVVEGKSGVDSSKKGYGGELAHFVIKIRGIESIFCCSTLQIGGIESVYVVAFSRNGVERLAHKSRIKALVLFVVVLTGIVVSFGAFIVAIMRSAQEKARLVDALAREKRKSTNKSVAFASASHEIRTSLAAISGLVDLCRAAAKPESELEGNLAQMSDCAMDLLGILNSVLDMTKIEAGKMELEEMEFSVAQLVEDVVDMFYPLGAKKGVDVVLDPTDCSILRFSLVKGDRGKLKQILCNLLSNATKFTSQGHISVRAMVKKSSTNIGGDYGRMEYIFEVDDTGEGIPKEMRESVFESFVQVKETALGQGTGLGLGIIQSLVRLMGGEIKIVDKDGDERGTCFRFNVVLVHTSNDGYPPTCIHHRFGMHSVSLASRPDASSSSLVILFLAGNERREVTERLMRRFGLRVSTVETSGDLARVLDTLPEHKLNNNGGTQSSSVLVVLDANAAPISEVCPGETRIRKCHHTLSRPLQGSHLYRALEMLPEFRGDGEVEHEGTRSTQNEIEVVVVSDNDQERTRKALDGKRVLLVEDDRTLSMLAKTILEKLGATLHVRENGKEALDLVCTTLPLAFDYIFMDCKMPIMDGFEATRLIRREEEAYGIHTPIIALTAYSMPHEINQIMEAGMDFHLIKPLHIQNVLHLIHQ